MKRQYVRLIGMLLVLLIICQTMLTSCGDLISDGIDGTPDLEETVGRLPSLENTGGATGDTPGDDTDDSPQGSEEESSGNEEKLPESSEEDSSSNEQTPPVEHPKPPFVITVIDGDEVLTADDGSYQLAVPEKEGHVFMGWITEAGEPFAAEGTVDGDVSVMAVFEKLTERGLTFSSNDRKYMTTPLSAFPVTVGFKIKLADGVPSGTDYGSMFSNSVRWDHHLSFDINKNRNPSINLAKLSGDPDGLLYFSAKGYVFDKVTIPVDEVVDLYFVINIKTSKIQCYFNGALAQTVKVGSTYLDSTGSYQHPFVIGGNTTGSNYNHFKGEIYDLAVWSDKRTEQEIANGGYGTSKAEDSALMVRYQFFNNIPSQLLLDQSGNGYDLKVDRLWLDKSEVESTEGDYCFAVVGDTQSLIYKHPEEMADMYDWLVDNAEAMNIRYVMGLGDITENATVPEWECAKENIYKLSGIVPFSVVIGNHDKYDYKDQNYMPQDRKDFLFNQYFCDETYLAELDGWYGEGDVTCAYNAFEIGNTKWLLLTLDFGPTDEMLAWASEVIAAHPDHKVIVTTHAYLYRDGTTLDRDDCYSSSRYNPEFNDGDQIFEKLISKHENIVLVMSGHDPHDHVVCSQVKGEKGNTITQLLIDPQYMDFFYGATGMVALLYFSEEDNTLTVRYYSTAKDMYGSEHSQFTVSLS